MAQSIATREGYGETLVELVKEGHDIMAVEADLSRTTIPPVSSTSASPSKT